MNRLLAFVAVFSLSVLPFVLGGCKQNEPQVQESKPPTPTTPTPEIKLPPKFGVFYESAQGPTELGEKTTLPAANPSFILYLENIPEAARLRLRLVKASGGPFIVDAGTVTSGKSSEPRTAPKPGNYQNVFVLEYGEDAGVFEPRITAVNGRSDLYKATYSGTLTPGHYFAFYFVDEPEGEKRWEKARFKFAGEFIVQ